LEGSYFVGLAHALKVHGPDNLFRMLDSSDQGNDSGIADRPNTTLATSLAL
jgi:hypothetical protein